ncbi:MAG: nucleoside kinase [Elusimicrobia bacterium]|nr:nucleoside kinase [Elusimicrobiota bacterium]
MSRKETGSNRRQNQKVFPEKRVICVAGPSASGKTTFLKRLGIEIRANGLIPVEISLDNYFVSRARTPRTSDGDYDYECLEAIDLKFFRRQIKNLLAGKIVSLPEYNFKRGCREFSGQRLKLRENSVILIEGIHALNPRLLPEIGETKKYKIFVSALTQLRIDNDNRIFTSDSRLIRRIVRDFKFRGYSAAESIRRFPKVREGEDKYIFPYQGGCDVFFNSSLIYEQAVIKKMASALLRKIKKTDDVYFEAQRLLYYFDFFLPISAEEVPQNSILREFIGESSFHY